MKTFQLLHEQDNFLEKLQVHNIYISLQLVYQSIKYNAQFLPLFLTFGINIIHYSCIANILQVHGYFYNWNKNQHHKLSPHFFRIYLYFRYFIYCLQISPLPRIRRAQYFVKFGVFPFQFLQAPSNPPY